MSNKRVLLVDDEIELLEAMQELLMAYDFDVTTATSGNIALEVLEKEKFDLILSDVRMADGDGLYFLEKLDKSLEQTPIFFFMTGFADFSAEEVAKKGAYGILNKPVAIDELIENLPEYLAVG